MTQRKTRGLLFALDPDPMTAADDDLELDDAIAAAITPRDGLSASDRVVQSAVLECLERLSGKTRPN